MPAPFEYSSLFQSQDDQRSGKYKCTALPNDPWADLSSIKKDAPRSGWKTHLTIAQDDVPRAWNIVSKAILDFAAAGERDKTNQAVGAKVGSPATVEAHSVPSSQQGKVIVIYEQAPLQSEVWQEFLTGVERKLRTVGIHPGLPIVNDLPITGSQFMGYRLDKLPDGRTISAKFDWQAIETTRSPFNAIAVSSESPGNSDEGGPTIKGTEPLLSPYDENALQKEKGEENDRLLNAAAGRLINLLDIKLTEVLEEDPTADIANSENWMPPLLMLNPETGKREKMVAAVPGIFTKEILMDSEQTLTRHSIKGFVLKPNETVDSLSLAVPVSQGEGKIIDRIIAALAEPIASGSGPVNNQQVVARPAMKN